MTARHALPTFSELLRPLILPPTALLLLALAGLLLARWHHRSGRALSAAALALLLVLSTPAGADLLVRPLEALAAPLSASAGRDAQAIVVLAAGRLEQAPEYDGADIPDYVALARLRYAAHLQHARGLPILVSGGNAPEDDAANSKAQAMATALRGDFRTPVQWVEGGSATTAENASRSAPVLQAAGVQHILLVTDAMHMARARLAFSRTALVVTPAPTIFLRLQQWTPESFLPSAEGLRRSWYASYEWLGLLWYHWHAAPTPASAH